MAGLSRLGRLVRVQLARSARRRRPRTRRGTATMPTARIRRRSPRSPTAARSCSAPTRAANAAEIARFSHARRRRSGGLRERGRAPRRSARPRRSPRRSRRSRRSTRRRARRSKARRRRSSSVSSRRRCSRRRSQPMGRSGPTPACAIRERRTSSPTIGPERAMGAQGAWGFVRGGMGAVSEPLAARGACRRRDAASPAARVERIALRDGRAARLELARRRVRRRRRDRRQRRSQDALPAAPRARRRSAAAARTRAVVARERDGAQAQPRARRAPELHARVRARRRSRITARRSTSRRRLDFLQRAYEDTRTGVSRGADARVLHADADRSVARAARETHPLDLRAVLPVRSTRPPVGSRRSRRDRRPHRRAARGVRAEPAERDRTPADPRAARPRSAASGLCGRSDLPRRTAPGPDLRAALRRAHRDRRTLPLRLRNPPGRLRERLSRAGAPPPPSCTTAPRWVPDETTRS